MAVLAFNQTLDGQLSLKISCFGVDIDREDLGQSICRLPFVTVFTRIRNPQLFKDADDGVLQRNSRGKEMVFPDLLLGLVVRHAGNDTAKPRQARWREP